MSDDLRHIPLDEIDEDALPRDRSVIDAEAQAELCRSILRSGQRTPLEVFAQSGGRPWGLISGFRRLAALRELAGQGLERFSTAACLVRAPADLATALAEMVEENTVRRDPSPWEKGLTLVRARDAHVFETIDAAVEGLHPSANRTTRSRLRALAHLVEELDGALTAPETLTVRQCLRLSAALRAGFGEVIEAALAEPGPRDPAAQWSKLAAILAEAEEAGRDPTPYRPGHPRRVLTPRQGVTIRRERTPQGWALHFTGPSATGLLLDSVMDEIERQYSA